MFSLAFRYLGVWIWRNILYDLGSKKLPSFSVLSLVYAKAWMARYIPGTIAWVAGKVLLAQNLGISKSRLTAATLTEIGVQIISIAIISLLLIGTNDRLQDLVSFNIKILVFLFVCILFITMIPRVFNFILREAYHLIRKQEASIELAINNKAVVRSFITYSFGAFISGSVYFFLMLAIWGETSISDYFYIVGASNLAGVIGMLTPLVPSGFGTRDASLLILLSAIVPKEVALTITVASRLWTAIVDVLFYVVCNFSAVKKPDIEHLYVNKNNQD